METKDRIALQVQSNQHLNLLASIEVASFEFTESIKELILQIAQEQWHKQELTELIDLCVKTALASFYEVNQYYYFDRAACTELERIYFQLVLDIKEQRSGSIDFHSLGSKHFLRLKHWLLQYYPEAHHIYPSEIPKIEQPVVCAEYSAALQLEVIGIDINTLVEPILDIGCGKEQQLVTYLQQKGFAAYGLDRMVNESATSFQESWLEFDYKPHHWGTIISHLGFSNHFLHQHLRQSELALQYATTFKRILTSLKEGGTFYYTPGLPFIESYLSSVEFKVETKQVKGTIFQASSITRLFEIIRTEVGGCIRS